MTVVYFGLGSRRDYHKVITDDNKLPSALRVAILVAFRDQASDHPFTTVSVMDGTKTVRYQINAARETLSPISDVDRFGLTINVPSEDIHVQLKSEL
jgi:hypothetical protein